MNLERESMHDKAIRLSAERQRERERQASERLAEGYRIAQEMFHELLPRYRIFQPAKDILLIRADAHDWLQRKFPDVTVPEVVAEHHVDQVVFPRIGEFIADLIRQQEGDPFHLL